MNLFETDHLHHAYLLEGDATVIVPEVRRLLETNLGITIAGNPDFQHLRFESMSVDDARELSENQTNKAFGAGTKKIFIIETTAITNEAQNALLKTLEEPTADTHFFIVMPSRWLLLPTVRSRVQTVVGPHAKKTETSALAFLAATPGERIAMLAPILEEKDKVAAMAFVDGVIGALHAQSPDKNPNKKTFALKELLHLRQYLNDRSASLKLVLEHIALVVPPLAV